MAKKGIKRGLSGKNCLSAILSAAAGLGIGVGARTMFTKDGIDMLNDEIIGYVIPVLAGTYIATKVDEGEPRDYLINPAVLTAFYKIGCEISPFGW